MKTQTPTDADKQVAEMKRQLAERTAELSEAHAQQAAAAEILQVINSSPADLGPVFDAILQRAHALCGIAHGSLQLCGGEHVRAVAVHGLSEPFADILLKPRPIAEAPTVQALLRGQRYFQVDDVRESNAANLRTTAKLQGARTLLAVPLRREGKLLGMIVSARREVKPFTEKEIGLLESFAAQAVIAIENARLLQELRARTDDLAESLQQQTATADVLKVISRSAFDLQTVLETLSHSAVELSGAKRCVIFLRDGDVFRFRAASYTDISPDWLRWLQENPHRAGRHALVARAILTAQTVCIPDFLADPELEVSAPAVSISGIRAGLAVPLLRDGKVEGIIALSRPTPGPFTQRQIELVQTFADQAVIAIENARLFDEVQAKTRDLEEALRYQTGSANMLKVIASSPTDVEPVLQAIVESACDLCEANDAAVLLKDGDDLRFRAHHGPIEINVEKWPISRGWTAGRAFLDGRPVHLHDTLSDEGREFPDSKALSESTRSAGIRTVLSVPLMRENERVGAIVLRRTEVNPFNDKQITLLQTFADQAVIALGNVRLFDEVQAKTRDLEESLQQQTAIGDVLKIISRSTFDLQPVLDTLVETAARLCNTEMAFIMRREGDVYLPGAAVGHSDAFFEFLKSNPVAIGRGTITGRAALERRTVHILDMAADPEYTMPQTVALSGQRSAVAVPLLRENEPIGVLVLGRQRVEAFTAKQIDLLTTFADQAVIAIENVRLFDELRQRTDDLAASLNELRAAQDRLIQTEKLASLGQLTAGIAHEIKNPLNFVNNFSALSVELTDELNDVLKQATLAEKIRAEIDELTGLLKDNLRKVVQHGKRADSIVKNMLLHSREGSGEHRPADVNALVDESLNLAYHGARAEKPHFNVTLMRNFDPDAGQIEVFPQEITRVLLNLISNGFYAVAKRKADNGGANFEPLVTATTKGGADRVEIRIRDNGTGILPHVKEKMFNPFFTTKPAGEGTGLGLSMSHDIIVKQHGGTIEVETEPGEFTEFTIVLPRTKNHSNKTRG
jgi:two-component system, NtrC family, sensor kinase